MGPNHRLVLPTWKSVNDGIDLDITTLTYIRVNDVAQKVAMLGKGTNMAKVDVEEAYRLMPIHSDDKHLLEMHWEGQVYIDTSASEVHPLFSQPSQTVWNG